MKEIKQQASKSDISPHSSFLPDRDQHHRASTPNAWLALAHVILTTGLRGEYYYHPITDQEIKVARVKGLTKGHEAEGTGELEFQCGFVRREQRPCFSAS